MISAFPERSGPASPLPAPSSSRGWERSDRVSGSGGGGGRDGGGCSVQGFGVEGAPEQLTRVSGRGATMQMADVKEELVGAVVSALKARCLQNGRSVKGAPSSSSSSSSPPPTRTLSPRIEAGSGRGRRPLSATGNDDQQTTDRSKKSSSGNGGRKRGRPPKPRISCKDDEDEVQVIEEKMPDGRSLGGKSSKMLLSTSRLAAPSYVSHQFPIQLSKGCKAKLVKQMLASAKDLTAAGTNGLDLSSGTLFGHRSNDGSSLIETLSACTNMNVVNCRLVINDKIREKLLRGEHLEAKRPDEKAASATSPISVISPSTSPSPSTSFSSDASRKENADNLSSPSSVSSVAKFYGVQSAGPSASKGNGARIAGVKQRKKTASIKGRGLKDDDDEKLKNRSVKEPLKQGRQKRIPATETVSGNCLDDQIKKQLEKKKRGRKPKLFSKEILKAARAAFQLGSSAGPKVPPLAIGKGKDSYDCAATAGGSKSKFVGKNLRPTSVLASPLALQSKKSARMSAKCNLKQMAKLQGLLRNSHKVALGFNNSPKLGNVNRPLSQNLAAASKTSLVSSMDMVKMTQSHLMATSTPVKRGRACLGKSTGPPKSTVMKASAKAAKKSSGAKSQALSSSTRFGFVNRSNERSRQLLRPMPFSKKFASHIQFRREFLLKTLHLKATGTADKDVDAPPHKLFVPSEIFQVLLADFKMDESVLQTLLLKIRCCLQKTCHVRKVVNTGPDFLLEDTVWMSLDAARYLVSLITEPTQANLSLKGSNSGASSSFPAFFVRCLSQLSSAAVVKARKIDSLLAGENTKKKSKRKKHPTAKLMGSEISLGSNSILLASFSSEDGVDTQEQGTRDPSESTIFSINATPAKKVTPRPSLGIGKISQELLTQCGGKFSGRLRPKYRHLLIEDDDTTAFFQVPKSSSLSLEGAPKTGTDGADVVKSAKLAKGGPGNIAKKSSKSSLIRKKNGDQVKRPRGRPPKNTRNVPDVSSKAGLQEDGGNGSGDLGLLRNYHKIITPPKPWPIKPARKFGVNSAVVARRLAFDSASSGPPDRDKPVNGDLGNGGGSGSCTPTGKKVSVVYNIDMPTFCLAGLVENRPLEIEGWFSNKISVLKSLSLGAAGTSTEGKAGRKGGGRPVGALANLLGASSATAPSSGSLTKSKKGLKKKGKRKVSVQYSNGQESILNLEDYQRAMLIRISEGEPSPPSPLPPHSTDGGASGLPNTKGADQKNGMESKKELNNQNGNLSSDHRGDPEMANVLARATELLKVARKIEKVSIQGLGRSKVIFKDISFLPRGWRKTAFVAGDGSIRTQYTDESGSVTFDSFTAAVQHVLRRQGDDANTVRGQAEAFGQMEDVRIRRTPRKTAKRIRVLVDDDGDTGAGSAHSASQEVCNGRRGQALRNQKRRSGRAASAVSMDDDLRTNSPAPKLRRLDKKDDRADLPFGGRPTNSLLEDSPTSSSLACEKRTLRTRRPKSLPPKEP